MACVETALFVLIYFFYKEKKEEPIEDNQM
jgi:hypothetical protein